MRIPLAGYGTKEIVLFGGGSAAVLAILLLIGGPILFAAPIPAAVLFFTIWFFRDPTRKIPDEPGAVVAPADGKIVAIEDMEHEEWLDGPAKRIDIFLAVYNVHVNRVPLAGRADYLADRDGPYLSALNLAAGVENKAKCVGFVADDGGFRFLVRQIVGAIARRIVCPVKAGDRFAKGDRFGMIKFGSRTQLSLPAHLDFEVRVKIGDKVRGGSTVLGVIRGGERE